MWLTESNRPSHLLLAIPCAAAFTLLFVFGLAIGMEFKDRQHGGTFDWLDLLATIIGGVIGQAVQIAVILLCV